MEWIFGKISHHGAGISAALFSFFFFSEILISPETKQVGYEKFKKFNKERSVCIEKPVLSISKGQETATNQNQLQENIIC